MLCFCFLIHILFIFTLFLPIDLFQHSGPEGILSSVIKGIQLINVTVQSNMAKTSSPNLYT